MKKQTDKEQEKTTVVDTTAFPSVEQRTTLKDIGTLPAVKIDTLKVLSNVGPSTLSDRIPDGLRKLSGFPTRKTGVTVYLSDFENTQFFQGLYVVTAKTSKGKSITTAALINAIVQLNDVQEVTGTYFYVFEEGAPIYVGVSSTEGTGTLASIQSSESLFSNPGNFINDANTVIGIARAKFDRSIRLILVFDSITLAVKAYDPRGTRAKSGTFEGGLQPADSEFFVDLGKLCSSLNVTIVGVINPDVVPVGSIVEALVEGTIEVHSPGSFSKKERGSGRTSITFTLSAESVEVGAAALGYPSRATQQKQQMMAAELDHPFNRVPQQKS